MCVYICIYTHIRISSIERPDGCYNMIYYTIIYYTIIYYTIFLHPITYYNNIYDTLLYNTISYNVTVQKSIERPMRCGTTRLTLLV